MPLSYTATRDLLRKLGHNPKRFLGQNFLVDGNIVRKSLELAQIAPNERVVEIGPGLGTLTRGLLDAGTEVWAIEKDARLYAHLAQTLVPDNAARLHLMEGDAVAHPLAGFAPAADMPIAAPQTEASATDATARWKIVANLPYAISTPWMVGVLTTAAHNLAQRMVLMLQLEAAERYAAQPGSKAFGAISIFLQSAYEIAPGHRVSGHCFYPKPDVDSYLLSLVRRAEPIVFSPETRAIIRACFQQRRKQLGSLLRGTPLPKAAAHAWLDTLAAAGFPSQTRPEAVPLALWQELDVFTQQATS